MAKSEDIEYTSFNKVKYIAEADNELNMAYGPYSQRIWQQNTNAHNNIRRQKYYYTPEYEIETNAENQEIHRHYLLSPTGVFAIFTAMNDDQQMHYLLKDHQGSLMGLTDVDGMLAESYSYDAFGRRRNAQNWSYDNITTSSITDRGYTFHEHMDAFGLINMNGRVYDPLVGQMLSPDPFIQQPEYSQSYNRYGYVFNNPLRFTDPSGYFASGDTTGTQQNNAESIVIRQAREDQQKERLSYNTDESTDGPGVNQLQVEGEEKQACRVDPVSAGVWATTINIALIDNLFVEVSKNFKALQAESNLLKLGLDYSNELSKTGKFIKGVRIGGGIVGLFGIGYDANNTFGYNPTMSKGKFWTNASFTAVGFIGVPGAVVSGVYFGGDLFIPGGWEAVPMHNINMINNTSRDGVWRAPFLFGK